jgi:hypothetical protein
MLTQDFPNPQLKTPQKWTWVGGAVLSFIGGNRCKIMVPIGLTDASFQRLNGAESESAPKS